MDSYDILIVGAGPAGSSCAWGLRDAGLRIAILDRQTFPRDKVCGGWITPAVFDELAIDPAEYAHGRVLQPIEGFRTGCMSGRELETHYGTPVSYGIRRCEFDDYLLKRSGARVFEGVSLKQLERSVDGWMINRQIRASMLVGAGGTFCPIARFLGAKVNRETVVTAKEAEFEMDERQIAGCSIRADMPELYFCPDMKGYGWCFRKQNILNVGLGRLDPRGLAGHVAEFLHFLKATGKLAFDVPRALVGHAYLLFGDSGRAVAEDGVLLIGDAAGVAYGQSGEGIRPAIESGLLAAKVIVAAQGCYSRDRLAPYRVQLTEQFGGSGDHWAMRIGQRLPPRLVSLIARRLMTTHWFTREVVLNRWFLRQRSSGPAPCF